MKTKLMTMLLAAGAMLGAWADTHGKVQLWENGPYWATTNVGAEKPEDYGYYFWWGDTTGYRPSGTTFDFRFYYDNTVISTCGKSDSQLKSEGWLTDDGVLAPEHDAAHVLWGGKWRMPTFQELLDLIDNCDWSPTTMNGVDGFEVRGRGGYASASIFLPFAGYGAETSVYNSGSRGYYWSSSSIPESSNSSWGLFFESGSGTSDDDRYFGQSVRPIQDAPPVTVETWTSGDCTVTLDSAGTLTVSGTGAMAAYEHSYSRPWYDNCNQIKSVVIEHGVTNIGDYAFYDCGNLTSVTIGDSVTSIGYRAFDQSGLSSVTIPSSVKSIGGWAFSFCQSLTSVVIPEGVESIGGWAFAHSDYLESVSIPSSVTRFEPAVFYDCDRLANVTMQDGIKSIGNRMFDDCTNLTSVTIPASVTSIGAEAFQYCSGLTNVTMLGNVTSIGDEAFIDCISLASITLPESLTSIGMRAFYNCASLAGIAIPAGVASIGDGAFKGCVSLADGDGFVIVRNFLYDYTGAETSVAIPDGIVGIGLETFKDLASLTGVTIPDSV